MLDQITKSLVRSKLWLYDSIHLLPFFALTHVENTGAAFGLARSFPGGNIILILVSIGVLVFFFIQRRFFFDLGEWGLWGMGLIWGGAVGNLIDRVAFGHVTDFLDFYWSQWHWPAFNVADSAITVGAILLGFGAMKGSHR